MFQVKSKDCEALSQLYDESSALVFSIALRILDNRDDAEEVTLDVYTQVWNQASAWDPGRGSVTSWLLLLARSRALDRLRWRKSRSGPTTGAEELRALPDPAQGPELLFAIQQRWQQIQTALSQLSEAHRQALELVFYGGLTQQAIAEKLDEPLGTVKSRIRLAMLRLKGLLEEQGYQLESQTE